MWHRAHICTQGLGFSLSAGSSVDNKRPYNLNKPKTNHTRIMITGLFTA